MSKYLYKIIAGFTKGIAHIHEYKYNRTSGRFKIYQSGFVFEVLMTKKYNSFDEMINSYPMFTDVLKKGTIALLLYNSKKPSFRTFEVVFPNKREKINIKDDGFPAFFWISDLPEKQIKLIPDEANIESIVDKLMLWKKSNENKLIASLFAYIIAKLCSSETEKLIYYWMSMNGIYGYLSQTIKPILNELINEGNSKNKNNHIPETIQIEILAAYFKCISYFSFNNPLITEKIRNCIVPKLEPCIMKWDKETLIKNDTSINHIDLIDSVENTLKTENVSCMSGLGFILFELPYYLRCQLFHASHAPVLLSINEEYEIKRMSLANKTMENFILNNLHHFFEDDYIENVKTVFKNGRFDADKKKLYLYEEAGK